MDSQLQIIINAVDNASSTISGVGGSLDGLSGALETAEHGFELLSAAAIAAEGAILTAGADAQVATVNLNTSIQDNINIANAAAKGQGAFAEELTYAKTQMNLANNELAKMTTVHVESADAVKKHHEELTNLQNTLESEETHLKILQSEHTKTSIAAQNHMLSIDNLKNSIEKTKTSISDLTGKMGESSTASKYSADQIEAQRLKVETLTQKFDELNGRMSLVGKSAKDIENQFAPAIDAGLKLGFTFDDTSGALNTLENVLGNPTTALKALSTAQDLSREKGIGLSDAANMVVMGMNGMGRGLQTAGIFIKDGLGGMAALDAIQQQVDGHAKAYADTLNGQLRIAWSQIEDVMARVGGIQIPWLTDMLKDFNSLVGIIKEFVTHTKTAQTDLNDFLAKMGIGKDTINAFKMAWSLISDEWKTEVMPNLKALWIVLEPLMPYFKEFAGVVLLGTILVVEALIAAIAKLIDVGIKVTSWISDQAISIFTALKNEIMDVVNWVQQLFGWLSKITGIGGGGGGGGIGGFFSGLGHMLGLAEGGIVTSPTIAMIGEAGPEAVIPLSGMGSFNMGAGAPGQSNGGITININNLFGTDQNAARQFANMIARQLNQQLRLKTI